VGSAACAGCHAEELAAWRGSHHDLAIQDVTPESVLGDFGGVSFSHFDVQTRFLRSDGRPVVRTQGGDGEVHDYEVAYAFGVEPLQQYLVKLPGGRLQVLPFVWDTRPEEKGGQRWFHLYPDEALPPGDLLHWAGPNQNWNHMCAECHSTQLRKGYRPEDGRYETTWDELDVACEACHGPASEHVDWASQPAHPGGETAAPATHDKGLVVDLSEARGDWAFRDGEAIARRRTPVAKRQEVELCARCHSRRSSLSEDYVHGRPLLDTHRPALLEAGLYHADGQILGEVYVYGSFLQSRMYAAGVSCSDCHEPHALELRGGAEPVCLGCHRSEVYAMRSHHHHEPGTEGARCVSCHMPAATYMGVDIRHDHGFRVPRPDLADRLGVPDPCSDCHAERTPAWAAEVVAGWRGPENAPPPHFAEIIEAGRRRAPAATRHLARLADDRRQPGIVRATALELLAEQGPPPPEATLETALSDADPLVRLGAVGASERLEPAARVRLVAPRLRDDVRGVRIEAARVLVDAPLTGAERSAQANAMAELRAALRHDADRPEAHLELGILSARVGELAKAEAAYRQALVLVSEFTPAVVNLADVYRLAGRDADAEMILAEAIARAPEEADLHHVLGLARVRLGKRDEALSSLERAALLAPQRPRYAYVRAVALHGTGQTAAALRVLAEAQTRHPHDRDLLMALALFSRDGGDQEAARRWAERLVELDPSDREAQALLRSLIGPAPPSPAPAGR